MKNTLVASCVLTGLFCVGVDVVAISAQGPAKQITALPTIAWNPTSVELKEGDSVEWILQKNQPAEHGVIIKDWATAQQFLEPVVVPQPNFPAPAAGTSRNAMLRLRVKKAPDQPVTVNFVCTVHGNGMQGHLTIKK